ncbi:hypothetical protein VYU27_010607, partial [Nannochloropsis oceanica]
GLWLGTSAGIMKTVPKYMTAVVVKDKHFTPTLHLSGRSPPLSFLAASKARNAAMARTMLVTPAAAKCQGGKGMMQ